MQILHTDLHTSPWRILLKDRNIFLFSDHWLILKTFSLYDVLML